MEGGEGAAGRQDDVPFFVSRYLIICCASRSTSPVIWKRKQRDDGMLANALCVCACNVKVLVSRMVAVRSGVYTMLLRSASAEALLCSALFLQAARYGLTHPGYFNST